MLLFSLIKKRSQERLKGVFDPPKARNNEGKATNCRRRRCRIRLKQRGEKEEAIGKR